MASVSMFRNKWRCQVRRKGQPTISKTFGTREEAIAWGNSVEEQLASGAVLRRQGKRSVRTVENLLDWYLGLDEAKAKRSARDDVCRANTLKQHLGRIDAFALTSARLKEYKAMRRAMPRSAAQTVQHELSLLHRAYVLAVEEFQWVLPQGIPKVKRQTLDNLRTRRVPQAELIALIEACHSEEAGLAFELAVETAMRRGELLGLTWERVNLERRSAFLADTKTGRPRTVPLTDRALELLMARKRAGDTGPVFTIKAGSVLQALKRAAKRIGSEDIRFHDFRHEATSRFFERRLSQIEVAKITGHRTLAMLDRYTHLDVGHLVDRLKEDHTVRFSAEDVLALLARVTNQG